MDGRVLGSSSSVVFIKDPSILPEKAKHHEVIDALSRSNSLVVLLSHGNKYALPTDYVLPSNAHIVEYDFTMDSIQTATRQIKRLLQDYGVAVHSRHLDNGEALPIVLSGSVLTTTAATALQFVNNASEFSKLKTTAKTEVTPSTSDWDFFDE